MKDSTLGVIVSIVMGVAMLVGLVGYGYGTRESKTDIPDKTPINLPADQIEFPYNSPVMWAESSWIREEGGKEYHIEFGFCEGGIVLWRKGKELNQNGLSEIQIIGRVKDK